MNALKPFMTCAALLLCSANTSWSATIEIPATVAANISDFHFAPDNVTGIQDGDGDEFSTALYPWLAAGTDLVGGSGQNGTARFQMEFDISALTGLNITSATLVLRSDYKGDMNDNTAFIWHVIGDEDGTTTASDFETPAVDTGLSIAPVFVDSVHELDVTNFVRADVLAGKMFSSFQGRSDEIATNAFKQTIEFLRSTVADPNVGPVLLIEATPVPEPGTFAIAGCAMLFLVLRRARHRH